MQFVYLCKLENIPAPGALQEVAVQGRQLCLANHQGTLAAIDNNCPHRQGPLADGTLEDGKVLCPWHAWAFDLATGEADHDPRAKVQVFPLEVHGPDVMIGLA